MKLSVSLPDVDIEFLDAYANQHAISTRSGALQRAIAALRALELRDDYEDAFEEWGESEEAVRWDQVSADGLTR